MALERRALALYETTLDWPEDERLTRLGEMLADDPQALSAVLKLIRAEAGAPLIPTRPPAFFPRTPSPSRLPERIGAYRITDEIGRGGMGVIYRGERDDGVFEQHVAIKCIHAGLFSAAALAQFATERRLLARLHHPHIAQLLDGGVDAAGTSYIVMELIEGIPITDYAAERDLDLAGRLDLFEQACAAVDYAHRHLTVHADIKPGNVVVADSFGVKLLDFGIARMIDPDGAEKAGAAHTPGFARPSRLRGAALTPADDIFGLGVLLRALIAGVPGADADLLAIVDKAAAEDEAAGYGTVTAFAADLDRWRRHEPVSARPPSRWRRAWLLWRRHRVLISAGAAVLALSIGTAIATTILYLEANSARTAAEQRFAETRSLSRYLIDDVTQALAPLPGSDPIRQRIALRANHMLEKLSQVPGASSELQVDSARGYIRVGEILANTDLRDRQDPDAGNRALAHAEGILRRLVATWPGRSDLAVELARAEVARARGLSVEGSQARAALALLDAARARLDRVLARNPADPAAQTVHWDADLARARILDMQEEYATLLKELPQVIAHYGALPLPATSERALRFESGWTLLADAQWYLGDQAAALASYRKALDTLRQPAFANDARVVARQGYAAFNIAGSLVVAKRLPEALATIETGVAAMERLRVFDSGPRALHMEAIVRLEYATELGALGRFDEAIGQARASIAERIAQARLQPASYEALRSVPVAFRPLGELYRSAGRPVEACRALAEAEAGWSALSRRMPLARFDAAGERVLVRQLRAPCPR